MNIFKNLFKKKKITYSFGVDPDGNKYVVYFNGKTTCAKALTQLNGKNITITDPSLLNHTFYIDSDGNLVSESNEGINNSNLK
jgi:hypothetical protein